MQLERVTVSAPSREPMVLDLRTPQSGLVVKDIQGLGPVKSNIVTSNYANQDGERINSTRRGKRNVVITLTLDPDYSERTVGSLRDYVYQFFTPPLPVNLKFALHDPYTDSAALANQVREVEAVVESCEPDIFTAEPTLVASLICEESDLKGVDLIEINGSSVNDLTETIINYEGNIPTGFLLSVMPNRTIEGFTVYLQNEQNELRILQYDSEEGSGDQIDVSSLRGEKFVNLISGGETTSVPWKLTPQSDWLELFPGENRIRVYIPGEFPVPWEASYYPRYGGV